MGRLVGRHSSHRGVEVSRIRVLYPSGRNVTFTGLYEGTLDIDGCLTVLVTPDRDFHIGDHFVAAGSALLLDPRAVVLDLDASVTLYSPAREGLGSELDEWMGAHPEWPAVAEG